MDRNQRLLIDGRTDCDSDVFSGFDGRLLGGQSLDYLADLHREGVCVLTRRTLDLMNGEYELFQGSNGEPISLNHGLRLVDRTGADVIVSEGAWIETNLGRVSIAAINGELAEFMVRVGRLLDDIRIDYVDCIEGITDDLRTKIIDKVLLYVIREGGLISFMNSRCWQLEDEKFAAEFLNVIADLIIVKHASRELRISAKVDEIKFLLSLIANNDVETLRRFIANFFANIIDNKNSGEMTEENIDFFNLLRGQHSFGDNLRDLARILYDIIRKYYTPKDRQIAIDLISKLNQDSPAFAVLIAADIPVDEIVREGRL